MAITSEFLADNLSCLLTGELSPPGRIEIQEAFDRKDSALIAKLVQLIARDIQARSSTLPFPGSDIDTDPAGRKLMMATHYLDEIGRAVGGRALDPEFPQPGFDQLGWHAFGAAVQAIAGLLTHLEQVR
jgi:hypothetical protein